ncbi:DUF6787 family protein [Imtechella halotolerans]|uniref:DUF6787 domain-containing protein n=1 Tax=Imtechella halotolerans K1 TaxID=946077 RepID=I0W785_9FLAO|nr:DUF6787 family protein [Imtechella halotolerans]EID72251.1 hypothetical protein W5A_12126 [Imtechella halotolerans K1]WMQ64354.1 diacylglyceryl transferase [Imtechella halotolerans]
MKKLKERWNITSNFQLVIIFIVFGITGTTASMIASPITEWIGLELETTNKWIYWPVRILLIFPPYQVLLVFFGWLFGQFQFFWNFEKKMLRSLGIKI